MLAQIAEQAKLGRSSLRHCKAFLSGAFRQAKRLGILDGLNPIQDTSIPNVPEAEQDTYAYSLSEINSMLAVLPEPARTIVLTAAFTGLRKSELRGLTWGSYSGEQLSVRGSQAPCRKIGGARSADLSGWKRQAFKPRQHCATCHPSGALALRDLR